MTVKGNIRRTSLERYIDESSDGPAAHIGRSGDKLYLPRVFCHNGHLLSTDEVTFEGQPAIHILVRHQTAEHHFYLSPILNDQSKEGPELPDGTKMQVLCPVCREVLPQLIPCSCQPGAYRRALYLTDNPKEMCAVGICEVYGCPQSFVNDEGELQYEIVKI